ncbi:MAG: VOC family protein, partial [Gemmatimonadota bacterium]|nr:VOC family protein [Gemmatimonadota bacterium]
MANVLGLHHVSAIAGDPQRNIDFYAGVLGLRLVKRTVNFDDPQTYHFYFGDERGTPGSLMTFFPWRGARQGRQGTGQVAVTAFAIAPGAIGFWLERLVRQGVRHEAPTRRDGAGGEERVIAFRDHDGLMLELVASAGAESKSGWDGTPGVRADHAIRCFDSVTLWVEQGDDSARVLTTVLGFHETHEAEDTRTFLAGDGGPAKVVRLRSIGGFPRGVGGRGTVHHVAFAVTDDNAELTLREQVLAGGLDPTPVIDRSYFRSVYFREPGGVLYELATSGPGFLTDEPLDQLGERLMLPPKYEPMRADIEAALPTVHLPSAPTGEAFMTDALDFVHRYLPPAAASGEPGSTTLLLLHGTGGDEEDLIPLGRTLLPGAGLLSPRGKVLERGAPRFFRRLAEGVFDLEDLALRTDELAAFIGAAARRYSLDRDNIVAVGFSNGANIAASLLLRLPGTIRGAVLLSPMVPFEPDATPELAGTSVFIGAGRADPITPPEQAERLAELLRDGGAD